jgi:hypothetical protein
MRARVLAPLFALAYASPVHADYGDFPDQSQNAAVMEAPAPTTPQAKGPKLDLELAALGGFLAAPIRGGTNPFGLGFGARAGMVASHIYVGATITKFLGESDVTQSDASLLGGVELGYGFVLHSSPHFHVELRPVVGVGDAAISHTDPSILQNAKVDVTTTASGRTVTSRNTPSDTMTINNVYIRPKLALVLQHDWQMLVLEGGGLVIPGISYGGADPSTWLSYGVELQVGARF